MAGLAGQLVTGGAFLPNQGQVYNPYTGQYQQSGNIGPLSSYGTPQVPTTSTVPTTTPTQQPQAPTSSGNTQSIRDQMLSGKIPWDDNLLNSGGNQSGGGIQAPSIDFNALYQPAFDALTNRQNVLTNTVEPTMEGDISTAANDLIAKLNSGQTSFDQLTSQQQGVLDQQQQSAYGQAARQAAASRQWAINTYGGDTAGQGYSQMADMEFARAMGSIGSSYATSLGDLLTKQQAVHQYVFDKTYQENADAAQKKLDARSWLQEQVQSIMESSASLSVDKAKMVASVNDNYQNLLNNNEASKNARLDAFNIWKQQQQYAIDNQLTGYKNTAANYSINNPFAKITAADNQGITTTNTTANDNSAAMQAIGYTPRSQQDQLQQILSQYPYNA